MKIIYEKIRSKKSRGNVPLNAHIHISSILFEENSVLPSPTSLWNPISSAYKFLSHRVEYSRRLFLVILLISSTVTGTILKIFQQFFSNFWKSVIPCFIHLYVSISTVLYINFTSAIALLIWLNMLVFLVWFVPWRCSLGKYKYSPFIVYIHYSTYSKIFWHLYQHSIQTEYLLSDSHTNHCVCIVFYS